MFLPAMLASATLMASDVNNSEMQQRMADVRNFISLRYLIRSAQVLNGQMLAKNPDSVKNKCSFAACCYLLQEDDKAEKLWQEVIEVYPNHEEANTNLKKLYYRRAIEFHDHAADSGLSLEIRDSLILIGRDYAKDALEASELYTLDQEKIKELTEMFGLQVELDQEEKK